MTIHAIQNHVQMVLAQADSKDIFEQRLEQLAGEDPDSLTKKSRKNIRKLAKNYVESTVWLLAEVDGITTQLGLQSSAGPVLQTAAAYFLSPDDMIPDQQGLYGLLDDAYLAVRFMARLSEVYAAQSGVPLFDVSLDSKSPTIRQLIGEPLATQLDSAVEQGVTQALSQAALAQLTPYQYRSPAHWNQWMHHQNQVAVEAEISAIAGGAF
jgi:uncharacterized membrane protein YkvA (DUF1232 family)